MFLKWYLICLYNNPDSRERVGPQRVSKFYIRMYREKSIKILLTKTNWPEMLLIVQKHPQMVKIKVCVNRAPLANLRPQWLNGLEFSQKIYEGIAIKYLILKIYNTKRKSILLKNLKTCWDKFENINNENINNEKYKQDRHCKVV